MFWSINIIPDAKFGCDESEANVSFYIERIEASLVHPIGFRDDLSLLAHLSSKKSHTLSYQFKKA